MAGQEIIEISDSDDEPAGAGGDEPTPGSSNALPVDLTAASDDEAPPADDGVVAPADGEEAPADVVVAPADGLAAPAAADDAPAEVQEAHAASPSAPPTSAFCDVDTDDSEDPASFLGRSHCTSVSEAASAEAEAPAPPRSAAKRPASPVEGAPAAQKPRASRGFLKPPAPTDAELWTAFKRRLADWGRVVPHPVIEGLIAVEDALTPAEEDALSAALLPYFDEIELKQQYQTRAFHLGPFNRGGNPCACDHMANKIWAGTEYAKGGDNQYEPVPQIREPVEPPAAIPAGPLTDLRRRIHAVRVPGCLEPNSLDGILYDRPGSRIGAHRDDPWSGKTVWLHTLDGAAMMTFVLRESVTKKESRSRSRCRAGRSSSCRATRAKSSTTQSKWATSITRTAAGASR